MLHSTKWFKLLRICTNYTHSYNSVMCSFEVINFLNRGIDMPLLSVWTKMSSNPPCRPRNESTISDEKWIQHYCKPAWSVALAGDACERVVLLKKYHSMLRTSLDCTPALQSETERGIFKELIPTTQQDCSHQKRIARAHVAAIINESIVRRDQEHEEKIAELEASILQSDTESAKRLCLIKRAEAIK